MLIERKIARVKEFQGVRQLDLNPKGLKLIYIALKDERLHFSILGNIRAALFQK